MLLVDSHRAGEYVERAVVGAASVQCRKVSEFVLATSRRSPTADVLVWLSSRMLATAGNALTQQSLTTDPFSFPSYLLFICLLIRLLLLHIVPFYDKVMACVA